MEKLIYFDEFPKHLISEKEKEKEEKSEGEDEETATTEYEGDDVSDISYDPATTTLKNVFKIINKLNDKQKKYRKTLIFSDKTDVTNRDLLIKQLESIRREIDFFDMEFQRVLTDEENQYKGDL